MRASRPRGAGARTAAMIGVCGVAAGIVVGWAGCGSGLQQIDDKITHVLERSKLEVRSEADVPQRTEPVPGGVDDPGLRRWSVPTDNPPASELTYKVADEARDVSKRLEQLQTEELVGARELTLVESLRQAQVTAREHLTAQEEYLLAAIRLLIERHAWDPRLFNDTFAGFVGAQVDGDTTSTLNIMNELGVRQKFLGGAEVVARWVVNAAENLRSSATEQYKQSSQIALDVSIPLLRGAGDAANESRIQAERSLIYAARDYERFRRDFLVSIASDYFALLQQLDGIKNQESQLKSLRLLEDRQRAWFEAGKLREMDVNLASNQVLGAVASLANARESYILALDRFKIRLGLSVTDPLVIKPGQIEVPEPDVTLAEATQMALLYRLDLQNQRDQLDDTKRGVWLAQNQLLPDMFLTGRVGLPTDADAREAGFIYELDDVEYSAGVTFGLPLDRETERLQLRASIISLEQAKRSYAQARDVVILEVRSRVREVERSKFNLVLAEQRVDITKRRAEEQEIRADEVDTQSKIDTANDLLAAEQARDQAKTDLRNSVLDYLLATATLRVGRDGVFVPLPGMPAGTNPPPPDGQTEPGRPE